MNTSGYGPGNFTKYINNSSVRPPAVYGTLDYRHFFNDSRMEDPAGFLSKYPTDILIIKLAKINAILFSCGSDVSAMDNKVFTQVFNKLDRKIYLTLREIRSTQLGKYGVVFTPQVLVTLMAALMVRFKPVNSQERVTNTIERDLQKDLFAAILSLNELYYERMNTGDLRSHHYLWTMELMQQSFARNIVKIYDVIPLRVFLFYRFIKEQFGEHIQQEFADYFRIPTVYDFNFIFLNTILAAHGQHEQFEEPRYCITEERLQEIIKPFTINLSDQGRFTGDSMDLVNKPFYRMAEGVIILDFDFFSHLMDISQIFHFYRVTSLKTNPKLKNYNAYLGMLGKDFFERYLALQLLKKIFTNRFDKIETDDDDPDYPDILLTQNNKDIFVIEIKSTRAHGSTLNKADAADFRHFLETTFAKKKSAPGEKNKGIYQLKKQIEHLAIRGTKFRIFPIIIYTETVLDISGVNSFLDSKFEEIIAEHKNAFLKVHPLTLINMDFLIKYYPQMKADRIFMKEEIKKYHRQRTSKIKRSERENNNLKYLLAEASFMRYMEKSHPIKDRMTYFTMVADDFDFPKVPS